MFKKLGRLAACTMVFILSLTAVASAEEAPDIRVQLSGSSTSAGIAVAQGRYKVINGETGMSLGTAGEGNTYSVSKEGLSLRLSGIAKKDKVVKTQSIFFIPAEGEKQYLLSFNNIKYSGRITVYNTSQGLRVVNTLPLEEYLYGVVGQEMGYSAPPEALKAQALVSRSYALKKMGTGLYSDITNTAQAYKGYNAQLVSGFDTVKDAVDATKGEVICYQDNIIDAVFHSNGGGYTESSENVWQSPVPYLRGVASPEDAYAARYSYQDAKGWPGSCYEWSCTLTREQLNKCIAGWNVSHPSDVINIGEVTNIKLSRADSVTGKETASGRVTAVTLVGTSGEKVIKKDNIRSFFKVDGCILKSTLFDISLNFGSPGNNFAYDSSGEKYISLFASITIKGKGNGHGVGLSQWGARGMASEQEATYSDIVKHYYTGVELKKLY